MVYDPETSGNDDEVLNSLFLRATTDYELSPSEKLQHSVTLAIANALDDFDHRINTGEKLPYEDREVVARIRLSQAKDCFGAENPEAAHNHIDKMRRLPGLPASYVVEAYLNGAIFDDERSRLALMRLLKKEKASYRSLQDDYEAQTLWQNYEKSAMTALVEQIPALRVSIEDVVMEYAPDNQMEWWLDMRYARVLKQYGQSADEDTMLGHMHYFLERNSGLGPLFSVYAGDVALQAASSAQEKQNVLDAILYRLSAALEEGVHIAAVSRIAEIVTTDSDLCTSDNIQRMNQAILTAAEYKLANGEPLTKVQSHLIRWNLAQHLAANSPVNETLDDLDAHISTVQLQVEAAGTSADASDTRLYLEHYRQNILLPITAKHYARQHDFEAADEAVAKIADGVLRASIVSECLEFAMATEHVDSMRPLHEDVMWQPILTVPVAIAKARIMGDAPALMQGAQLIEQIPDHSTRRSAFKYVTEAYGLVRKLKSPDADNFAREMLLQARVEGYSYETVRTMSLALIEAGDTAEPQLAFEHIIKQTFNSGVKLRSLWQLDEALNKTSANT